MDTIVLASCNAGKLKELGAIFQEKNINVISQADVGAPDVPETGTTFIENALIKAHNVAKYCEHPVLADDSGLCVPAIDGAPGIYSARFAGEHGNDAKNNKLLLEKMQGVAPADRKAYFYCCLVLLRSKADPTPVIGQGYWWGEINHEPKGGNGFGYNPVFYLPEYKQTVAEITDEEKNRISHRRQALESLLSQL